VTLSQAEKYFDKMRKGFYKRESLDQIEESLTQHLWRYIYTTVLTEIYKVEDAAEMRRLIKSRTLPSLTNYNDKYFRWKVRQGVPISSPHHLTGKTKESTVVNVTGDKVLFYIPKSATIRSRTTKGGKTHTFNFGPIHEARKSILKATVVFAWQDIMKRIKKIYETI